MLRTMSTNTNVRTLVKASDYQEEKTDYVDPLTASVTTTVADLHRTEVQTTDDTVHTTGMYLTGTEPTTASSTNEATATYI